MTNNSQKIMIVDDDKASREILLALLRHKYDCIAVNNAKDAINTFISSFNDNKQKKIDLILLDFEMPDATGLDVLKRLKNEENKREIPKDTQVKIIMTTSHNEREIVMATLAAGANQFIIKPIQEEALFKKVNQLLPPVFENIKGPMPEEVPDF